MDIKKGYSFIPETPGWCVLNAIRGEKIIGFFREPVIAWRICSTVFPYRKPEKGPWVTVDPVTVDGVSGGGAAPLLLRPDGSVISVGVDEYENEADALAHVIAEQDA